MSKKITIIGLGYVGLAMATLCSNAKKNKKNLYSVYGLEQNNYRGKKICENLYNHTLPFKVNDNSFKSLLFNSIKKKILRFGHDINEVKNSDIIIVSINFDINLKNNIVSFQNLKTLIDNVSKIIKPDCLIFIESTLPPGTTSEVILPIIKKNFKKKNQINLSYSFERVMPGSNYLKSISSINRVFGSVNKSSERKTIKFLKSIINTNKYPLCKVSNTTEAETCKIIENSYRALNIAFIDEWRNFCENQNLDLNKILNFIRLRKTHKNIMHPGLSPGGYCLTKDPLFGIISSKYIFKKNKLDFPLSKKSIEINKKITTRVIKSIENQFPNISKSGKKVCIFGIAYKNDVGDTRHSSAEEVYDYFIKNKSQVFLFDPYVDYWKEKNQFVNKKIDFRKIDIAFFIAPHKSYKNIKFTFKKNCIIVDSNNVFSKQKKRFIKKKYLNYFFIGDQKN